MSFLANINAATTFYFKFEVKVLACNILFDIVSLLLSLYIASRAKNNRNKNFFKWIETFT